MTNHSLLMVRSVSVVFGGIVALSDVSFNMHEGQILGLIGPNGAGKTTLFNCLSRAYQPASGEILLSGESILSRPPTGGVFGVLLFLNIFIAQLRITSK